MTVKNTGRGGGGGIAIAVIRNGRKCQASRNNIQNHKKNSNQHHAITNNQNTNNESSRNTHRNSATSKNSCNDLRGKHKLCQREIQEYSLGVPSSILEVKVKF